MATQYSLTVKNNSKNYGNICVYQAMPDQPDNMLSLAWFSKAAHPETEVEFNWTTGYNFVWSDQGELKPGITFEASQVSTTCSMCSCPPCAEHSIQGTESLSEEDCEEISVELEENRVDDIQPKYYVAFGDFKEGETAEASMLENAVELELSGEGKTIVINEDNSISIE